uniref:Amino acid transporter n=1 Tax=Plectus sambesii TaxID=2011161 RepID=A0A914V1G1_9BILA
MGAFKKNLLLFLTIGAVFVGVFIGFAGRPFQPSSETIRMINFPGEIFMQFLKMMLLPLIIASLISALAQLDAKESSKMGLLTLAYYLTTTMLATFTGIVLVLSIHPGDPQLKDDWAEGTIDTNISTMDTFMDLVRNMFPENIVQATFQQVRTSYHLQKPNLLKRNGTSIGEQMDKMKPVVEYHDGINILGIIVCCTGFGIIISQLGEQGRLMVDFFIILDAIIMRGVAVVMWCAPVGILCLICANILEIDDLSDTAEMLAMYVVTVLCGLFIHSVVTLPILFFLVTRRSPIKFVKGMMQALVTSFGTASSGAALPTSFRCLEENNKVDRRISRFVLPLGATINMDGTALYEAVAVIFIAQLNGVTLSLAEVITVSLTATLASIGSGSMPAGLVTIMVVLTTVGLPVKDVSLIITVDWLLDRIRTVVNVLGDAFAAGIIHDLTQSQLVRVNTANRALTKAIQREIELLNGPLENFPVGPAGDTDELLNGSDEKRQKAFNSRSNVTRIEVGNQSGRNSFSNWTTAPLLSALRPIGNGADKPRRNSKKDTVVFFGEAEDE